MADAASDDRRRQTIEDIRSTARMIATFSGAIAPGVQFDSVKLPSELEQLPQPELEWLLRTLVADWNVTVTALSFFGDGAGGASYRSG